MAVEPATVQEQPVGLAEAILPFVIVQIMPPDRLQSNDAPARRLSLKELFLNDPDAAPTVRPRAELGPPVFAN